MNLFENKEKVTKTNQFLKNFNRPLFRSVGGLPTCLQRDKTKTEEKDYYKNMITNCGPLIPTQNSTKTIQNDILDNNGKFSSNYNEYEQINSSAHKKMETSLKKNMSDFTGSKGHLRSKVFIDVSRFNDMDEFTRKNKILNSSNMPPVVRNNNITMTKNFQSHKISIVEKLESCIDARKKKKKYPKT